MNDSYYNELNPAEGDDQTPKGIETQTMMTPEEFEKENGPVPVRCGVSEEQLEEDVIETNPDINSMEARG